MTHSRCLLMNMVGKVDENFELETGSKLSPTLMGFFLSASSVGKTCKWGGFVPLCWVLIALASQSSTESQLLTFYCVKM